MKSIKTLYILLITLVVPSVYSQLGYNRPPVFTEKPDIVAGSHCEVLTAQVKAKSRMLIPDYRNGTSIRYTLDYGPGNVDPVTGLWTYYPSLSDAGDTQTVTISAHQGSMQTTENDRCIFKVIIQNNKPTIAFQHIECGITVRQTTEGSRSIPLFTYDPDDCDENLETWLTVEPQPYGIIQLQGNKLVLEAEEQDVGNIYHITIGITDSKDSSYCDLYFEPQAVIPPVPFSIGIEKTTNTPLGTFESVDVTMDSGSELMAGFDMLIGYDAAALIFQNAKEGQQFYSDSVGCGWEYFTFRYGSFSTCNNNCPSGLIRIVGFADINNGPHHSTCNSPDSLPATLFTLYYNVSSDHQYDCQFFPIRFFWSDCGDNTFVSINGDTVFHSLFVYDSDSTVISSPDSFPTYFGAQDECISGNSFGSPQHIRLINYHNGGVDVICRDSIALIGDLNLNSVPYEITDAVLYSNYSVHGIAVFSIDQPAQIIASDVNGDGVPLTLEDFTYMVRVIVGDASPIPQNIPPGEVDVSVCEGIVDISTDDTLGTAHLLLEGVASPVLLIDNMNIKYAYNPQEDFTSVLIYSFSANTFFESGELIDIGENTLISSSFATYEGGKVTTSTFSTKGVTDNNILVSQNYPNPFNNETVISFTLPSPGPVTFEVYNVLGQMVYNHTAHYSDGNNQIIWKALNNAGAPVASGIYYYRIRTETKSNTRKMLLIK